MNVTVFTLNNIMKLKFKINIIIYHIILKKTNAFTILTNIYHISRVETFVTENSCHIHAYRDDTL